MIEVNDLSKNYGQFAALRGVSFSVQAGDIIGLLGPNGAGKTTIMKILAGFMHPSAGQALIDGIDVTMFPGKVQEMIGYLPENAPLYPELTVQGQLQMIASLRGIPARRQNKYLAEAIHAVGLEDKLIRPISTLSKGYRQRVGIAQAILHKPRLLILDEPTNGLDPTQIVEVRHLIRSLAQQTTVIVSTHILSEVEATCNRAIIIMNGLVKADADLADLAVSSAVLVSFIDVHNLVNMQDLLAAIPGCNRVEIVERHAASVSFRLHLDSGNICSDIYRLACKNDWQLCHLMPETKTLEAVFNQLTGATGGGQ